MKKPKITEPNNQITEQWVHRDIEKLEKALNWAENNTPKDNFNNVIKKLENESNQI